MSRAGSADRDAAPRANERSPLARVLAELASDPPGEGAGRAPDASAGRPARRSARQLARPAKRSLTIAGHRTSVSLEEAFWLVLRAMAEDEGLSLNALAARVDDERLQAGERASIIAGEGSAGLSGALRVAALLWLIDRSGADGNGEAGDAASRQ